MLQRFHADVRGDRLRAIKATLMSTPQVLSSVNPATGQAALHVAIEASSAETVAVLRRHGARFVDADRDGNNGLHYVALYGRADLLTHAPADPADWRRAATSANHMQATPLHTLLEHPPRDSAVAAALVEALMRAGADSVRPDAHGRTALELAAEHPTLHDLTNRLALELPNPHAGDIADGSPVPSPRGASGHARSPRVRASHASRSPTPPFSTSSSASPHGVGGGAVAASPRHAARTPRTPQSNYGHGATSHEHLAALSRYGAAPAASPRTASSNGRTKSGRSQRLRPSRVAAAGEVESARRVRGSPPTRSAAGDIETPQSASGGGGGFGMLDGGSGITFSPPAPFSASHSAPHNGFGRADASSPSRSTGELDGRVAEAEASIGELRGEVARLAAASAAAPRGLQPLEHEVEDVRAAVAEVAARVDAASVAATTTRERSDGLEKEVRKLQSRAADARHLQRATEDAVREVATFVAELEERLPDADTSTREAAAREADGEEGGKPAAADVAKLAADLAAHAKVVERLRFAVAAQQAAADEAKAAAAAPQSALETGSTSRDAVEAALAALAQRVGLVESTTTSAAQDAKEAAAAAADAREAARRAEAAPPQPATPPQSTGSTDAAVAETAAAVAALQGDVTALRGEVAALAAARVPAQAEAASAAAPDPAALATRLGRLEEASTVLAGQQQQLSRQLKKQASDGSMPATPRGTGSDPVAATSTGALDPDLVQRAINKLQQRIVGLEQERQAQAAFNEKQAALLQMLLERVHQAERRLPLADDDF